MMIKPMTLEAAMKKGCPFAKSLPDGEANSWICDANACMAWSSRPDGKGWCIHNRCDVNPCEGCKNENNFGDYCRSCLAGGKWEAAND